MSSNPPKVKEPLPGPNNTNEKQPAKIKVRRESKLLKRVPLESVQKEKTVKKNVTKVVAAKPRRESKNYPRSTKPESVQSSHSDNAKKDNESRLWTRRNDHKTELETSQSSNATKNETENKQRATSRKRKAEDELKATSPSNAKNNENKQEVTSGKRKAEDKLELAQSAKSRNSDKEGKEKASSGKKKTEEELELAQPSEAKNQNEEEATVLKTKANVENECNSHILAVPSWVLKFGSFAAALEANPPNTTDLRIAFNKFVDEVDKIKVVMKDYEKLDRYSTKVNYVYAENTHMSEALEHNRVELDGQLKKIADLEEINEDLKGQILKLEETISNADDSHVYNEILEQARVDNHSLKMHATKLEEANQKLTEEIFALNEDYRKMHDDHVAISEDCQKFQDEYYNVAVKNKKLTSQMSAANDKNAELQAHNEECTSLLSAANNKYAELQTSEDEHLAMIKKLNTDLLELTQQCNERQVTSEDLQMQLNKANEQIATLTTNYQRQKIELDNRQIELNDSNIYNLELAETIAHIKAEFKDYAKVKADLSAIQECNSKLTKINTELEDSKNEMKKEITILNAQREEYLKDFKILEAQKDTLNKEFLKVTHTSIECEKLKAQLSEALAKSAQNNEEIQTTLKDCDELKALLKESNEKLDMLDEKFKESSEERDNLKDQLRVAQERAAAVYEENVQKSRQEAEARKLRLCLENQITKLNHEKQLAFDNTCQQEMKISKVTENNDELRELNQTLEETVKTMAAQKLDLKNKLSSVTTDLSSVEEQRQIERRDRESLRVEKEDLQVKFAEMQAKSIEITEHLKAVQSENEKLKTILACKYKEGEANSITTLEGNDDQNVNRSSTPTDNNTEDAQLSIWKGVLDGKSTEDLVHDIQTLQQQLIERKTLMANTNNQWGIQLEDLVEKLNDSKKQLEEQSGKIHSQEVTIKKQDIQMTGLRIQIASYKTKEKANKPQPQQVALLNRSMSTQELSGTAAIPICGVDMSRHTLAQLQLHTLQQGISSTSIYGSVFRVRQEIPKNTEYSTNVPMMPYMQHQGGAVNLCTPNRLLRRASERPGRVSSRASGINTAPINMSPLFLEGAREIRPSTVDPNRLQMNFNTANEFQFGSTSTMGSQAASNAQRIGGIFEPTVAQTSSCETANEPRLLRRNSMVEKSSRAPYYPSINQMSFSRGFQQTPNNAQIPGMFNALHAQESNIAQAQNNGYAPGSVFNNHLPGSMFTQQSQMAAQDPAQMGAYDEQFQSRVTVAISPPTTIMGPPISPGNSNAQWVHQDQPKTPTRKTNRKTTPRK